MIGFVRRGVMACLVAAPVGHSARHRLLNQPPPDPIINCAWGGEVEHELRLGAAELARLPHTSVKAKDHSGAESTFDGVPLINLLELAGVRFGEGLRGKSLALYLVVEASDGYRAVFALPELDPVFTDRVVLLADRRDGSKLSASEGPLRIIVPGEKRQARWVRQVSALIIKRG